MTTLKDIAALAGVSMGTVSTVLNNASNTIKVRETTRKKVLKAAARLKYVPNHIARSLVTRRTNTVGLLFHAVNDRAHSDRLFEIQEYLGKADYLGIIATWQATGNPFHKACQTLVARGVDGVICCHFETDVLAGGPPAVLMAYEDKRFDFISNDHHQTMRQALCYLRELGHSRVGFIGLRAERRYQGFLENGGNPEYAFLLSDPAALASEALAFFSSMPKPPTACICYNDMSAMHFISAAMSRGWKVPEDISVIGMDNIRDGALFWPALTTFDSKISETSGMLVDILLDRIRNPESPLRQVIQEWPLLVRNSCARGSVKSNIKK